MQEGECQSLRVRVDIENFVFQQAAQRAGSDVADRVVAGFARGQANVRQLVQQRRHLWQRNEMILDILPGGEMALAASEFIGDGCELIHLLGRQNSAGNLGADHVHAGLPLAVDAAAQALCAKLVVRDFAGRELFSVRSEQFNVGANRGVVFGFGLLLQGLPWVWDDLFGDHSYDPYLDRDYYILDSITIGQVPPGVVADSVS